MNRLEEIQELIKKFIYEKQQMRQEINAIEEKRNVLAQERNRKINENKQKAYTEEVEASINALGNKIKELGNQSQEIQNELDKKYFGVKQYILSEINKDISTIIPEIKKIQEEKVGLQHQIEEKEKRDERYIEQKQEFYNRFGRIPVLSENAVKENELQEEEYKKNKECFEKISIEIKEKEEKIAELVKIVNDFKRGNWKEYIDNSQENRIDENNEKNKILEEYAKKIVEEVINPIVEEIVADKKEENKIETVNNIDTEEDSIVLPFINEEFQKETSQEEVKETNIEEISVEDIKPIEEVNIEEIEAIEDIDLEEIKPIEEITLEEINTISEINIEDIETNEESDTKGINTIEEISEEETKITEDVKMEDNATFETNQNEEIENLQPTAINTEEIEQPIANEFYEENIEEKSLEEILEEQEEKIEQQENNINNFDENKLEEESILYKDEIESEKTEKNNIYYGGKVVLTNINAKLENSEIVYIAQISNGDCIKIYPRKLQNGNMLLKDKENREELKEILINYAIAEYRIFDKKVIKKIDPAVCEILIRFAKKYNYDAQNLIYNYAMSFSKNDETELENVPSITYNFSFLQETNLNKKEKEIITKICKNAKKNNKIYIVGYNTGIKRIKYILKRTFNGNNLNELPEGKY